MKMLICNVSELLFEDKKRSNRPADLAESVEEPTSGEYVDCLVAFVTVEAGDGDAQVMFMASEIRRALQDVGSRPIVLMPFAHLSNRLEKKELAQGRLVQIAEELASDCEVTLPTFGFHKRLRVGLDIRGHAGSVAFRDSNPPQQSR